MARRGLTRHPAPERIWSLLIWILPAAAVLLARMPMTDLAYQVRGGDLMAHGAGILRADPFTFVVAGQPWVDQQWGAQLLLWAMHVPFGWRGLTLVRALIVGAAFGTTFLWTRRANGSTRVAALITLGALLVTMGVPGTLALRPQLLAVLLFLAAGWVIRNRHEDPRRLAALPLLALMWVNLHGSFVLLLVMVSIALAADLMARRHDARWTALAALGCVVATLANPWGPGVYRYLFDLWTSPIVRNVVDEWRPIWRQVPAGPLFLLASIGGLALYVRQRRRTPSFEEAATLAVFSALALLSGRNLLWWGLTVPPILGALVVSGPPRAEDRSWAGTVVAAVLAGVLALGVVRVATVSQAEDLLSEAPVGITAALAHQLQVRDARVFDGWWGSWFEYAIPGVPMFVDARVEIFPASVWTDYFAVSSASSGWAEILDRWGIGIVVASRDHQGPLIAAMTGDDRWQAVYSDADGTVFVLRA